MLPLGRATRASNDTEHPVGGPGAGEEAAAERHRLRRAGRDAAAAGDWEASLDHYERLDELTRRRGRAVGESDLARLQTARLQAARRARLRGDLQAARSVLTRMCHADACDPRAWRELGHVAASTGDWATTLECWETVHDLETEGDSEAGRAARLTATLRAGAPDVPETATGALCLVDRDADPVLASLVVQLVTADTVVGDQPIARLPQGRRGAVDITDLFTPGSQQDEELTRTARAETSRLIDQLLPRLEDHLVDPLVRAVLDDLRHDLHTRVTACLRQHHAGIQLLDPSRFGSVVLVGGGDLHRTLLLAALERLEPDRVLVAEAAAGQPLRLRPATSDDATSGTGGHSAPDHGRIEAPDYSVSPEHVPGSPCVLAWPLPNHVKALVPVVQELAQRGPVSVLPLSRKRKHRELLAAYHDLATTLPVAVDDRLAPRSSQVDPRVSRRCAEAVPHLEVMLPELDLGALEPLRPQITTEVVAVVRDLLPQAHGLARHVEHLFDVSRPSIMVISRDRGWQNRIPAMVARRHRVPTLLVQSSLLSPSARHAPLPTDSVAVLDDYARNLHIEHFGAPAENVEVTGFPSFEHVRNSFLSHPDQQEPADREAAAVLLAMQRDAVEEATTLVHAVAEALEQVERPTRLLVKAHPKATEGLVAHLHALVGGLESSGTCKVEVVDGDIYELIERCELVVSQWSTTLLEAALLGRLAVAVSLDGRQLPVPFDEMGVAHGTYSQDELRSALPELLRPSELRARAHAGQRRYLTANAHLLEGAPASKRIADTIERRAAAS